MNSVAVLAMRQAHQAPKRHDWKVGDVRGAWELVRAVGNDVATSAFLFFACQACRLAGVVTEKRIHRYTVWKLEKTPCSACTRRAADLAKKGGE